MHLPTLFGGAEPDIHHHLGRSGFFSRAWCPKSKGEKKKKKKKSFAGATDRPSSLSDDTYLRGKTLQDEQCFLPRQYLTNRERLILFPQNRAESKRIRGRSSGRLPASSINEALFYYYYYDFPWLIWSITPEQPLFSDQIASEGASHNERRGHRCFVLSGFRGLLIPFRQQLFPLKGGNTSGEQGSR